MPSSEDYFQRLKLSDLLSRTFALYASNVKVILGVSLAAILPFIVFDLFQYSLTDTDEEHLFTGGSFVERHHVRGGMELVMDRCLTQILFQLWRAAIVWVVCNAYIEIQPSISESFRHVLSKAGSLVAGAWPLLLSLVASTVLPLMLSSNRGASTFAAILTNLFFYIVYLRVFMYVPAVVAEGKNAPNALRRSWELSGYGTCFIIISLLLITLLTSVVELMWQAVMTSEKLDYGGYSYAALAGLNLIYVVTKPSAFVLEAVLYLHFRVERESLNQDVLTQDLTGSTPIFDRTPNAGSYEPVMVDAADTEVV